MNSSPSSIDALLLLAPGCPHCPTVLDGLGQLVKQGLLGRLEVVNIASHPETASELGVRSVPWVRIGEFELQGAHSPGELKLWAERATAPDGVALYIRELLSAGQLASTIALVRRHPDWLKAALSLLADKDSGMALKTGLAALIEEFTGSKLLIAQIDTLAQLLTHPHHGIRADACYFLGLCHSPQALPYLQQAVSDAHSEVQEIARDALVELSQMGIN